MDFKTGDLLCITPVKEAFVWDPLLPDAAQIAMRLELKKHHEYFGTYLGFAKHSKDYYYYIVMHNKCYMFWKRDFDFKCVTEG